MEAFRILSTGSVDSLNYKQQVHSFEHIGAHDPNPAPGLIMGQWGGKGGGAGDHNIEQGNIMGRPPPVKTHLNTFWKCAPGTTSVLPGLFKTADTVFCQKRIKLRIESETRKIETLNLRARVSGFIILCASIFSQDEEFEKPEPYSHTLTRDLIFEKPFYI